MQFTQLPARQCLANFIAPFSTSVIRRCQDKPPLTSSHTQQRADFVHDLFASVCISSGFDVVLYGSARHIRAVPDLKILTPIQRSWLAARHRSRGSQQRVGWHYCRQ